MRVMVFEGGDGLAEGAAAEIAASLRALPLDRRINLALSGGSTPRPVYEALRWESIPWERLDLWLSDERWVPPDDEASNGRMAEEALAGHVEATFHRPRWSPVLDPDDSAAYYEAVLREVVADGRPDVVLLGMGEDGHTASLFPGVDPPAEEWRWYRAVHVPHLDAWRLTATPALLSRSRHLVVLVSGAAKAGVVAEAIEGPEDRHPIQLVRRAHGEVTWMLDESAAGELRGTPLERRG